MTPSLLYYVAIYSGYKILKFIGWNILEILMWHLGVRLFKLRIQNMERSIEPNERGRRPVDGI